MSSQPPSGDSNPPAAAARRFLPYSKWWPVIAGASAGIAFRLAFSGKPGDPYAAMMGAFIYICPVIVGAVTVYVAEMRTRRSWTYYFWAPFLANLLFILGTVLILIEGWICAIVIAPLFALFGGAGGLLMGAVCRVTKWPKQTLLGLGIAPFLLGALEAGLPLPVRSNAVERTVLVDAAPERIWRHILNAPDIRADELNSAWIFRIGVPLPLSGTTRTGPDGAVRRVVMGKQIYFDETISEQQEHRFVRWKYRFHQDSFPPYALDEHVVIGGHYFDLTDTAYTLTAAGSRTELKIRVQYRVSTQFNWYADRVAQLLLGNMAERNLEFYRRRSEVAALPSKME
jgi:hypothetical protein